MQQKMKFICHLTVNIMGKKWTMGNFHNSSFIQMALQTILKSTDEEQVCPEINDPTLIDYAERKVLIFLYQVDYKNQFLIGKLLSV